MVLKKGVSAAGEGKLFIVQICQKKVPMFRTNELVSLHTKKLAIKHLKLQPKSLDPTLTAKKYFQEETKNVALLGGRKASC